jgi:hypothetical protein
MPVAAVGISPAPTLHTAVTALQQSAVQCSTVLYDWVRQQTIARDTRPRNERRKSKDYGYNRAAFGVWSAMQCSAVGKGLKRATGKRLSQKRLVQYNYAKPGCPGRQDT